MCTDGPSERGRGRGEPRFPDSHLGVFSSGVGRCCLQMGFLGQPLLIFVTQPNQVGAILSNRWQPGRLGIKAKGTRGRQAGEGGGRRAQAAARAGPPLGSGNRSAPGAVGLHSSPVPPGRWMAASRVPVPTLDPPNPAGQSPHLNPQPQ
jgi:hypothetical protein